VKKCIEKLYVISVFIFRHCEEYPFFITTRNTLSLVIASGAKQSIKIAKKVIPVFFEIKPHKLKMFNASRCWIAALPLVARNDNLPPSLRGKNAVIDEAIHMN
jgi:hypothetical protein